MTKPLYRRVHVGETFTVGRCYPEAKRIVIATEWTQSKHQLRIALLHELAHAIAGRDRYDGHGPRWQATARELGVPAWNIRMHVELETGTPTPMRSSSGKFHGWEPSPQNRVTATSDRHARAR